MGERGVVGGRFRLVRPIGDGGMGSVWEARDAAHDGRAVALKVIPAGQDEALHARFHREAKLIRQFSHRNIVAVHDAGEIEDEGLLFMAMELLHGSPLGSHLKPGEPLGAEEVLPVLVDVCRGLEEAHRAGVIHRDIKPENIFLALVPGEGVVPKILDFGLSTRKDRKLQTRITAEGQVLGSPLYMSPEQAAARGDLTPATDVWAVGVILYEAVTGRLPFFAANVDEVLSAVLSRAPAEVPASVDPGTRAIIARCLEKDPARRYPDAGALGVELTRALAALRGKQTVEELPRAARPIVDRAEDGPAGGRRRWSMAVVIAVLMAMGALLVAALMKGHAR